MEIGLFRAITVKLNETLGYDCFETIILNS